MSARAVGTASLCRRRARASARPGRGQEAGGTRMLLACIARSPSQAASPRASGTAPEAGVAAQLRERTRRAHAEGERGYARPTPPRVHSRRWGAACNCSPATPPPEQRTQSAVHGRPPRRRPSGGHAGACAVVRGVCVWSGVTIDDVGADPGGDWRETESDSEVSIVDS